MSDTSKLQDAASTTAEDLKVLLREAEQALSDSTSEAGDKFDELRERLRGALNDGKHSLARLRDEAGRQAKKADELVRSHPYQAIGIAAGVGALIGFLFARSQR